MVSEPTHMDGCLSDHSYFMIQFVVRKHVNSTVKNIFISDQDAVKFDIQKINRKDIDRDIDVQFMLILFKSSGTLSKSFLRLIKRLFRLSEGLVGYL